MRMHMRIHTYELLYLISNLSVTFPFSDKFKQINPYSSITMIQQKEVITLKGDKELWKKFTTEVRNNDLLVWGVVKEMIIQYLEQQNSKKISQIKP